MERITLALFLSLLLSIACKDATGMRVADLHVSWMEWLAQVEAGKPVKVFTAGIYGCGSTYVRRYEVDEANSTILFNPYEIVPEQPCVNVVPPLFGDTITLVGLVPGTYKLQSGDRVFGEVAVTADPSEASALIAAGGAIMVRDPDDCVRLRPVGVYPRWPVENPPDTGSDWSGGFFRGQLIDPPAPLCKSVTVFRILSRE